ncbi:hypothetical protein U0070_021327, partial [Myodes glareolus]
CILAPGPFPGLASLLGTFLGLRLRALREQRVSPRWQQGRRVPGARGHWAAVGSKQGPAGGRSGVHSDAGTRAAGVQMLFPPPLRAENEQISGEFLAYLFPFCFKNLWGFF